MTEDAEEYLSTRGGLVRAVEAVVDSINRRRVDPVAAMLVESAQLEFPASRRSLHGRARVVGHLRRLYRDLERSGPVQLAAAAALLPFEDEARYPCALVYDGPNRSFAICPALAEPGAGSRRGKIETLTVLTEPARLIAADRLAAPDFPDGLTAPRPLQG